LSIELFGQNDKPCGKVYQIADTLPLLISSTDHLVEVITSKIEIPDSLKLRKGSVLLKYIINCRGESVGFKVITVHDSDGNSIKNDFAILDSQIIPVLRKELRWIPARQNGKDVDFFQILSISFNSGKIAIKVTAT
jgi:hypothetical protein